MPMVRTADAQVITPHVGRSGWSKVRKAAKVEAEVSENLIERASSLFGKPFNPEEYLLTHATIVASVDTFEPPNVKLGKVTVDRFPVNRKYGNYRVKLGCDKFINNNHDCWDREVLAKSYRTFIGAHNFVEHVQIEGLSKGRIIDAVARDIGDSLYIDILIATDRKHKDLVEAIESGKMGTMSMGCTVDGTICTKCGHWAADETEMCPHIQYEKGNKFYDDQGQPHRVAELCGHPSIDPNGGNTFIEASWVGTPAFTGAVLRSIIQANRGTALGKAASAMLQVAPENWTKSQRRKAAALAFGGDHFYAGWDDEEDSGADEQAPAVKEPKKPFEDLEDELADYMKDRVRKRLKRDMEEKERDEALKLPASTHTNDNVVKQAAFRAAITTAVRFSSNDADLLNKVATVDAEYGVSIPVPLYRAALRLGSTSDYESLNLFARACHAALGRKPTVDEAKVLIRLGKLISLRGRARGVESIPPAVATGKETML